jgi:hypothetical protein
VPQNSGNPRGKRKWRRGRSTAAQSKQRGEKEGVGRRVVSGILPVGEGRGVDVLAEWGPQLAAARSRWRWTVPGGVEQGRRGGGFRSGGPLQWAGP